jgi:hypothetical protein
MNMRPSILAIALLGTFLSGCGSSPTEPDGPAWLQALIARIETEPVSNPPSSILSYRYRGELVYFRPARCCDIPSELYDEEGTLLCRPSGGFTGGGDGRCPDFAATRTDERLIWRDPRSQ